MACSVLPAPFEQPSARHRVIVVSDMLESNAFVADSEFIFILRLANTLYDVRVLDLSLAFHGNFVTHVQPTPFSTRL